MIRLFYPVYKQSKWKQIETQPQTQTQIRAQSQTLNRNGKSDVNTGDCLLRIINSVFVYIWFLMML